MPPGIEAIDAAPFVEREYQLGDQPLIVRFFTPFLAPGGEYRCDWAIHWPGKLRRRHSCGIDGLQALLLSMRSAHTALLDSEEFQAGRLTHLNERDLDLPPPFTFEPES